MSRGILHFGGHLLCDRSRPGCNGASRGLHIPACYIPQAEFCESCTCISALICAFKLPPNAMNIIQIVNKMVECTLAALVSVSRVLN